MKEHQIGSVTFGPPGRWDSTAGGRCLVCGEIGGHGNLQCPQLRIGDPSSPTPAYAPNLIPPWPGAQPVDYGKKLDRIIELLEQLLRGDKQHG